MCLMVPLRGNDFGKDVPARGSGPGLSTGLRSLRRAPGPRAARGRPRVRPPRVPRPTPLGGAGPVPVPALAVAPPVPPGTVFRGALSDLTESPGTAARCGSCTATAECAGAVDGRRWRVRRAGSGRRDRPSDPGGRLLRRSRREARDRWRRTRPRAGRVLRRPGSIASLLTFAPRAEADARSRAQGLGPGRSRRPRGPGAAGGPAVSRHRRRGVRWSRLARGLLSAGPDARVAWIPPPIGAARRCWSTPRHLERVNRVDLRTTLRRRAGGDGPKRLTRSRR
jgi:hypothetical protein